MYMKLFKLFICFGTLNLFYACSHTKSVQHTPNNNNTVVAPPVNSFVLQVDPHLENGKTLTLKMNDKFDVIFLRECIGCADVWKITNIDKDKISQQENTYRNQPATGTMGGYQDHIFHFTAKDKGTSTLSFSYFKESSSFTVQIN